MNTSSDKIFFYSSADLIKISEKMVDMAVSKGVTEASVDVNEHQGISVGVRMGSVETTESNREKVASITVFNRKRKGVASTSSFADEALLKTVTKAAEIARFTAEDEYSGLPDKSDIEFEPRKIPLYFPWALSNSEATDIALEAENSAFQVDKHVKNSDGAAVNTSHNNFYSINTLGFRGGYAYSNHSLSVSPIASVKSEMERDFWYSSDRDFRKLSSASEVGRYAAQRALSRLGSRQIKTCKVPILFEAPLAAGLLGSFVQAISGSALYKKLTFLSESLHDEIFANHINLVEDPFIPGAMGSAPFDNEGVKVFKRNVVTNGCIEGYFLSSYTARKLGMRTTGNSGGSHNLRLYSNADKQQKNLDEMLKNLDTGLFVTELMGQGVNSLTGDYSRGAAGFWVQNGTIQFPVYEVTIAGNLKEMFKRIVAIGADEYTRGSKTVGSILIESMTVGGQ
ncbi:MAG: metalloprotease PmbA [Betaproteobacteria bacterium TMED82]|nr:MAG: metalloprotease PmbA [Betaproteobacteria bacterium TMED82]